VLAPLGLWVRARRWRYLYPRQSDPPGLVAAMLIGYMINNVLPLRAGEVARVYVVAHRWGHGFWMVLATIIVERVLDGIAIVVMLAVLVLLIPVPAYLQWGATLLLGINVLGVASLALLAVAPDHARRMLLRFTGPWPRLARAAERIFIRFRDGLEGIRTPVHLAPLLAWTVVVWIVPVAGCWLVFRSLDLPLPWTAAWAVLAFVGVGVSIPSAPGYIGVFHAAAALALGVFGVSAAEALGCALVLHAVQFVPVTVVGWIALLREHVSLSDAAHAAAAAAAER
jgi:uncharacterized protein (TIRG00374 family)